MLDRQPRIHQESARLLDIYVHAVRDAGASNSAILTSAVWILQSAVASVTVSAQLSGNAKLWTRLQEELDALECKVQRQIGQSRQVLSSLPRPQRG